MFDRLAEEVERAGLDAGDACDDFFRLELDFELRLLDVEERRPICLGILKKSVGDSLRETWCPEAPLSSCLFSAGTWLSVTAVFALGARLPDTSAKDADFVSADFCFLASWGIGSSNKRRLSFFLKLV